MLAKARPGFILPTLISGIVLLIVYFSTCKHLLRERKKIISPYFGTLGDLFITVNYRFDSYWHWSGAKSWLENRLDSGISRQLVMSAEIVSKCKLKISATLNGLKFNFSGTGGKDKLDPSGLVMLTKG